jgi:hypothetical protein
MADISDVVRLQAEIGTISRRNAMSHPFSLDGPAGPLRPDRPRPVTAGPAIP